MLAKLNLEDDNVQEETLTVSEIRAPTVGPDNDDALQEKVYGWLDQAQGDVFTGKHDKVYLVITITK
jgi:hypothetical protein